MELNLKNTVYAAAELLHKIQKIARQALPWSLVLGILDYRFREVYWPEWNAWRAPLESTAYFDFFSCFAAFQVVFIMLHAKHIWMAWKNSPWNKFLSALLLIGSLLALTNDPPFDPVILNPKSQLLHLFWLPFLCGLGLQNAWQIAKKTNSKEYHHFTLHWLAAFGTLASAALIQWLSAKFGSPLFPGDVLDFMGRLVWPYVDPFAQLKVESANWLAYLAAPSSLMALILFQDHQHNSFKKRVFIAWSGTTNALILLLSQSYTGLAVSLSLGAIFLFKTSTPYLRKKILAAGFSLVIMSAPLWTQTQKFQILLGHYPHPNSIERREQISTVTLYYLFENPWQGMGAGDYQSTFRAVQNQWLSPPIPEHEIPPHPHNLILFLWSSLGLPGLFLGLSLYAKIAHQTWQLFKKTHPTNDEWINVILPLYVLGHGLADTPIALEEGSAIFWTQHASAENTQKQEASL